MPVLKADYTRSLENAFFTKAEMLKEAPLDETPDVFTPTGIQEDMIKAVAGVAPFKADPRVVAIIASNKVGKTSGILGGILKNIIWGPENDFFNYPVFKNFPFPKDGRIVGTKENTKEGGPIDQEIKKWWPRAKYERFKDGEHFFKRYEVQGHNGIYCFDVMTYQQAVEQFEGPVKGWTLTDEPPPPKLLGPIMSRFYIGGILIMGFTPIRCGLLMNWINDFETRGVRVNIVTANIYQNSITKGKPNSKGTKRGLQTDAQIDDYVKSCPPGEEDARIWGKANNSSGKVYPMFNYAHHVRAYDLMSDYLKTANHYMVMDPHRRYYPFMQWWAVTQDEKCICYNEWPTVETFKGKYYDEIRNTVSCQMSLDELSTIIKLNDLTQFGYVIRKRWIDPRFAKGTEGDYTSKTLGLVNEYAQMGRGLIFELPPFERIAAQRSVILDLMQVNLSMGINEFNEPSIFWLPHCKNSIRMMERHSFDEDEEKESEDENFKEGPDCTRMFLGGLGKIRWKDFSNAKKKFEVKRDSDIRREIMGDIPNTGLG